MDADKLSMLIASSAITLIMIPLTIYAAKYYWDRWKTKITRLQKSRRI